MEKLFDEKPFEIITKNELKVNEKLYGINFCLFNSTQLPILMTDNWKNKTSNSINTILEYCVNIF